MNHLSLFIVAVSCIYMVFGQGEESVPCKVKFMGTSCPSGRLVCEEDGDCVEGKQVCCYDGCSNICQNKITTAMSTNTQQVQSHPSSQEAGCPVVTVRYSFCRFSTYTPCFQPTDCPVPGACTTRPTYSCNRPISYDCLSDTNCMSNQRCCYVNCAYVCMRVSVDKSGYCPVSPSDTAQMIGCTVQDRCYDDGDCPNNQKCCAGPCGKQCIGAVKQKAGACGSQYDSKAAFCSRKQDICYKDGDCAGIQKCCKHQCGNKCKNPVSFHEQQYTCPPRRTGIQCTRWYNECKIDSDCGTTGKKCCNIGCGNACTIPTSYLFSG